MNAEPMAKGSVRLGSLPPKHSFALLENGTGGRPERRLEGCGDADAASRDSMRKNRFLGSRSMISVISFDVEHDRLSFDSAAAHIILLDTSRSGGETAGLVIWARSMIRPEACTVPEVWP
jgi:hypothetical protein